MKWFERTFDFDLPIWMAPNTLERLRGTPARVDARLNGIPTEVLGRRSGGAWSIQEQVGHLLDLEPLWLGRVEAVLQGQTKMRPADLANTKTHEANHNARPLVFLLSEFRMHRTALVSRLERLSTDDYGKSASHPRLDQPMRILDLMEFIAEHDDHHLAVISRMLAIF